MTEKNILVYQCAKGISLLGLCVLLASCADALDQTQGDLSASQGYDTLAMQLQKQGDDEGAAQYYLKALQHGPDDVVARRGLASLYEAHGSDTGAADQYKALVESDEDNIEYRRAYARELAKLNKPQEARAQYEAALAIDEDDAKSLNGLGVTLDLTGDHAAAQEQYKKALALNPNDLGAITNLGHSYVMAGNYPEAIKLLEPYYRNAGVPAELRQNLAEAYGLSGMDMDAARVMKMDMAPDEVKKRLAWYREMRSCTAPTPLLYADLGGFSTEVFAQARADKLQARFALALGDARLVVAPEVKEEGGTPSFHVHAAGFKNAPSLRLFCDKMKRSDTFCKVHAD